MITYFVLWCYLLIQGMAQIHRSSAFCKRRGVTVVDKRNMQSQINLALQHRTHLGRRRLPLLLRRRLPLLLRRRLPILLQRRRAAAPPPASPTHPLSRSTP
jgi:hypothetical protein